MFTFIVSSKEFVFILLNEVKMVRINKKLIILNIRKTLFLPKRKKSFLKNFQISLWQYQVCSVFFKKKESAKYEEKNEFLK